MTETAWYCVGCGEPAPDMVRHCTCATRLVSDGKLASYAANTIEAITLHRAFELGALAMRQLAMAKCGNLTESLQEGMMTDACLTRTEKTAMKHQVTAIDEVEKDIRAERSDDAAYYGSYILADVERAQIRTLFPQYPAERPKRAAPLLKSGEQATRELDHEIDAVLACQQTPPEKL